MKSSPCKLVFDFNFLLNAYVRFLFSYNTLVLDLLISTTSFICVTKMESNEKRKRKRRRDYRDDESGDVNDRK